MFLNRYLRQFLLLFVSWTLILSPKPLTAGEDFPAKPVKIIVYTGPGGLIDITARKFSQIASKYSDVNFIVENKPGAGGIVALKKILQSPADGYNLYACTKSNIAKFVQAGEKEYVDALDWTAMLMADPECVITNNQQQPYLWADLLDDARANSAKQTWVGPAAGGLDHVTAMKIWDTAGIKAKWIPFKSGGKAIAALLGGQGVAYVGNPRDVLGNPDLHIAAVSSSERLPAFPETPTFTELGLPDLEREFMWRGFALKQGTAPEIIDWYIDICQKVTDDREWQNFWAGGGIQVNLIHGDEFARLVQEDVETFTFYLQKSDIISQDHTTGFGRLSNGLPFLMILLVMVILLCAAGWFIYKSTSNQILGRVMIIGFFLILSIAFLLQTLAFPTSGSVGPGAVPRLWIYFLIPLNILLLIRTIRNREAVAKTDPKIKIVFTFTGFLILYLIAMVYIGYFISTFIFIVAGIVYLGYRNWRTIIIVASVWIAFSYLVFYRVLYVPLPLGSLIERLF